MLACVSVVPKTLLALAILVGILLSNEVVEEVVFAVLLGAVKVKFLIIGDNGFELFFELNIEAGEDI